MKIPIVFFLVGMLLFLPKITVSQNRLTNQNLFDTTTSMLDHYQDRVAQFEKEPINTGRIIFLGNSITEMGKWGDLLKDSTVVNRGIGGDITYGVLKRLDDIIKRKPSKLFILIGINDISKDIPEVVIADNYRKIIERVLKESPSTRIFIQSLLPLNPEYPGFPQHYNKQQHVTVLNDMLMALAKKTKTTYINLVPIFQDQKKYLNANYTTDGLHINEKGYKEWVNYLKKLGYL